MKMSKNSKYQTHKKSFKTLSKKPKRPNWRARSDFKTSIVAKHEKIEGGPFGKTFFQTKIRTTPKTLKRGTL